MFIPIGDDNPRQRVPYVTILLIGLNILFYFLWCSSEAVLDRTIKVHGLMPIEVDWSNAGWWQDIFTSMFMHANLFHLAGNMLFLWVFGDNVEDKLGPLLFAVFYLMAGVAPDPLHLS